MQENNFVRMISYVELLIQLRVSGTFLNGISLNLTSWEDFKVGI